MTIMLDRGGVGFKLDRYPAIEGEVDGSKT